MTRTAICLRYITLVLVVVAGLLAAPATQARPPAALPGTATVSAWTTDDVVTVFLSVVSDLGLFDQVRFAVDDQAYGDWQALTPTAVVQLPPHDGAHVIHIDLANSLLDPGEPGSTDAPIQLDLSTILDTVGPVTTAPDALVAARGTPLMVHVGVRDDLSPRARVNLEVRDRHGSAVTTVSLGACRTGATVARTVALRLPRGHYTYRVLATDLAGNAQRRAGTNTLVVK